MLCTKFLLQSLFWPFDQKRRKRNLLVQEPNVILATLQYAWLSGKELVLSEIERLAFSNFGEVVSVFKDRHEFSRKIRNSKKQVKIFPTGGDPMMLPRKISFHGSIWKEKVMLRYSCKTGHMLGESCPEAKLTPIRFWHVSHWAEWYSSWESGSRSEPSANANYQLESLTEPEFLRRNRPVCVLRKTDLWLRRLRLIWGWFLLVSERQIYTWKETNIDCYLLRLKLYADLIKAKRFSFLLLTNFIIL